MTGPIKGAEFRVTRLDEQGNPIGESFEIKGSMTGRITGTGPHPHLEEVDRLPPMEFKTLSMDVTIADVDPEAIALLTGTGKYTPGSTHSMTITGPVKRTFWQWLRRRPRQYRTTYLPHVTMGEVEFDE